MANWGVRIQQGNIYSPASSYSVLDSSTLLYSNTIWNGTNDTSLKVSGSLLRKQDNTRVVMRASTIWMLPMFGPWSQFQDLALTQYNNRDTIFAYMQSIGINMIRVGVCPQTYSSGADGDKTAFMNRLANIVTSAKSYGIYVLFCFWNADGSVPAAGTPLTNFLSVAGEVYAKIGADPWVMYEPMNEPNSITASAWETLTNTMIDYYRTTLGYTGVLYLGTTQWNSEFNTILTQINNVTTHATAVQNPPNIMWSHHRYANGMVDFFDTTVYANVNDFETEVGQYIGSYPICSTEWGWQNGDASTISATWFQQTVNYQAQTLVPRGWNGFTDFVWVWADNSMTVPLTTDGTLVKADGGGQPTATELTSLSGHGQIARDYFYLKVFDEGQTVTSFPSRLKVRSREIVNANNISMGTMRGFNIHAIADFPQTHFDNIAALGGKLLRVICRWDDFNSTVNTMNSSAVTALDHTITRAATAGLYIILDFHLISGGYPTFTSGQAAGEQKYLVYGQYMTQYLANRYGNPSSPQYAVNVIGFGPNELPVDDNTTRNGTGSIPYLENINRTWIGWMRTYAPDWIGFVCYGYASQTPLKVAGETNTSYVEASTTAYNAVGGNVVLDLHDYSIGDTRTTPPYDSRQFNGQLYAAANGGPGLGAGDRANYYRTTLTPLQMAAYVKPYKDFSVAAGIPLMVGEWGWPIKTGTSYTAGESLWIDDKQKIWEDAGAAVRLQWNYDTTNNYVVNPYTSKPNGNWRPSIVDEFGGDNGVFVSDDFSTGTTGAIAGRTGWSSVTSFANWTIGSSEAYCSGAEAWAYMTSLADTKEYEVSGELRVRSAATSVVAVGLGMTGGATRTGYFFTYESPTGNVRWLRIVAGVTTVLDSYTGLGAPTVGDIFRITIGRSNSGWITCYIGDSVMFENLDNTISTRGFGGIYATGSVTATTGLHFRQIQMSNVELEV